MRVPVGAFVAVRVGVTAPVAVCVGVRVMVAVGVTVGLLVTVGGVREMQEPPVQEASNTTGTRRTCQRSEPHKSWHTDSSRSPQACWLASESALA